MDLLLILEFAIFGIAVGFMAGFFGIGGGVIVVPMLTVFFKIEPKIAIGISIMQMLFSSLFGSYLNYKKKLFKFGDSFFVGIGGFLGALIAGFITKNTPDIYLQIALLIIIFIGIVKAFLTKSFSDNEVKLSRPILFVIGFCIGLCISVGIGGGLLINIIFFGFLGYDIKKAVSMGLFFALFASCAGFISLAVNGLVDYQKGTLIGLGALIGAYFGTNASAKIDRKLQKTLNVSFYSFVFILMLVKILVK